MNERAEFNAGQLVAPMNISDMCAARERALVAMKAALDDVAGAYDLVREAYTIGRGATAGHKSYLHSNDNRVVDNDMLRSFCVDTHFKAYERSLNAAVWTRVIEETRLKEIMDKEERDRLDKQMSRDEMPAPTFANISATIERLRADANLIFMRGVAGAFSRLDPAFKSHDAFKIGKRMIFTNVFSEWGDFCGWRGEDARQIFNDVERVFSQLNGQRTYGSLMNAISLSRRGGGGPRQSEFVGEYFIARGFKNGNLHLWIKDEKLLEKVNKVLAAYYGAVLPDAAGAESEPKDFVPGTAVAKDLAFYPTPEAVVDALLSGVSLKGKRVLEPSGGVGAIVRPVLDAGANVDAIEIHPDRAEALRGIAHEGLTVQCANFLSVKPMQNYDLVLMNPPFYGTHWMGHVRHAFEFLKEGGKLLAVLPVSAEVGSTNKHIRFRAWAEKHAPKGYIRELWRDLPPESFATVGVRINTVILQLMK